MPYRPATTKLSHGSNGSNGSNDSNAANPETEYFIWGATAGMIRNFYRFLLASNSL
jgi:hypothetical protein